MKLKRIPVIILIAFMLLGWIGAGNRAYAADAWSTFGAGISPNEVPEASMDIYDGNVYVAYIDGWNTDNGQAANTGMNGKLSVKKWDGSSWSLLDVRGISNYMVYSLSLKVSSAGIPYVAYAEWDSSTNNCYLWVKRYYNNAWETVGSSSLEEDPGEVSLAIDSNGDILVGYVDDYSSTPAYSVQKYSSGSWSLVGSAKFSGSISYPSFFVDGTTPYVAFRDSSISPGKATVMKYDSSSNSWVYVGGRGFSSGIADDTSLYVDNGTPYMEYTVTDTPGVTTDFYPVVNKYTGSWQTVGSERFSGSAGNSVSYPKLTMDSGILYLLFRDVINSGKASLMKYDGATWSYVGTRGFSTGGICYPDIKIYNGVPYAFYSYGSSGAVEAARYGTDAPAISFSAMRGSAATTTKVIATADSGDSFDVKVYSNRIMTPCVGETLPAGTSAYTSGTDIAGVDDTTSNKYIALFEVDSSNKIVKFKLITPSDISSNSPPTVTASAGTTSFTEGNNVTSTPVVIDSGITVSDSDNLTFAGGTVSITGNFQSGQDVLSFTNDGSTMGNISGSYNSSNGVLTLTSSGASATKAEWQAALCSVKYTNTSDTPNTLTRTISFVVNDGAADSAAETKSLSITAVDDDPTITNNNLMTITENAAATAINSTNLLVSDVDTAPESITYTITADPSKGTLKNGSTTLSASGTNTFTQANINSNAITYTPSLNQNGSDSFSFTVSDGAGGAIGTTTFNISITPVNNAPTLTNNNLLNINEDAAATVIDNSKLLVSDVEQAASALTYTITADPSKGTLKNGSTTLSASGTKNFTQADIDGSNITYTPSLNQNGADSFTFTVSDGAGGTLGSTTFNISITAINDTPTDINLSSTGISESAATGSAVGTFSTTDPDTGDTFTYTLAGGTGSDDNASFTISGNTLQTNTTFSYATKNNYTVRVRSTDAGGLYCEKQFTISITEVNVAPTNITLTSGSIAENSAPGSTVGTFSTTDPNLGDTTFIYTLVGGAGSTDNTSFTIQGNALKTVASFNYDIKSSYDIRVRSTDPGSLYCEKQFTISIINTYEAPTNITLSNSSIAENLAAATDVGTLASTDPDAGDSFTYSLVSGAGSTDNASFTIQGNTLKTAAAFNYEAKPAYGIRIRSTDAGGQYYEKQFTISITNVNDAPVATASSISTDVDTPVSETLQASDEDGDALTYSVVAQGTKGTLVITDNHTGAFTYTPEQEQTGSDTVSFRVYDSNLYSNTANISINIVPAGVADLNSLSISSGSINPAFEKNTLFYTASVDNSTSSISVTASVYNIYSTLKINGVSVTDAVYGASQTINLAEGRDNIIHLVVTAQDTSIYKDYILTVTRAASSAADLLDITASGVVLSPVFNSSTQSYAASVGNSVASTTLTVTKSSDSATVKINNELGTSKAITLLEGANTITIEVTAQNGTTKTYTLIITRAAATGGGTGNSGRNTNANTGTGVVIQVNGKSETAGTETTSNVGGQTVTTITVDSAKVEQELAQEGNNAVVTIPASNNSDVVVGELTGQTVKAMENKEAVLEIKTANVTYTLPAAQINIDAVSNQIGGQVELKDIKVNVQIAEPPQDTVKVIQDTADKNNYQLVVKPIEFNITCTSGNKTVEVSKFNGYVERTVAIPDGIDPSKITTGVVLNSDGTFSHVPTTIIVIDGKYYAKINSLTNSTYSVIYSPKTFADMENHWAKEAVNDMGSRLIIDGVGDGRFEPDRDITRAEFAAIVVRALGLMKPGTGKASYDDVAKSEWYYDAISIANEYGIISGYGNGKFGPADKITREQAMVMIARAMKITGLKVELGKDEAQKLLSGFDDWEESSDWARESLAACLKTGIISGRNDSMVAPKDSVTRAEVAVVVRKLLQKSSLI